MTNKIFKLIRECEATHEDVCDNKVYIMMNIENDEIIKVPGCKTKYYTSIQSLYDAYVCYLNSAVAINEDNIAFREIKLADYDLTNEDNNKLMKLILSNKINYSPKLFAQIVKYHNSFNIKFIKENKNVKCRVTCRKGSRYASLGVPLGYYIVNSDDIVESYYYAKTMPQLRELLLDEIKRGNIEITEAGLHMED